MTSSYKYDGERERISDPGDDGFPVVKSDSVPLEALPKYLYVGVGGDLVVKGRADGAAELTYKNVPNGSYIAFRAQFVMEATTCTDIVAVL